MTRSLTFLGLAIYVIGASVGLVLDTAQGVLKPALMFHLAVPALFFCAGAALSRRQDALPWFFIGGGLVSLCLAAWIVQSTASTDWFDAVAGTWGETGTRVWVHPLTLEPIRATSINSACWSAGLAALCLVAVRGWFLRSACPICAVGLLWVALVTETRGVLASVLIAAGVLVLRARTRVKLAVGVVGIGLLAVAGSLPERLGSQYTAEQGLTGRADIWRERVADVRSNPWGFGAGYSESAGVSCHNQPLEIAYMYGVVPAVGYCMAVLASLWAAFGVWRGSKVTSIDLALVCGFVALTIHSMTDSHILSSPSTFAAQMMLMGVLAGRKK